MTGPFRLDRSFIRVSGADAVSFLGNILTQSVEDIPQGGVGYAALLSPQGKVIADMLVWPDAEGVVIEADPLNKAELMRRLAMYKLRAQVTLDDVSDEYVSLFASPGFIGAKEDPRFPDGALGMRAAAGLAARAQGIAHGAGAYNELRLSLGVPDLARDAAPEEVFALEALLEELHGVDFQKGCFIGQENVSRMKRRATTRKKFCPIVFEGEAPTPMTPIRAGDAELGTVRSGMNGRAMALLRLDRAYEALEAGKILTAEGREIRLDPPSWLILPSRDAG